MGIGALFNAVFAVSRPGRTSDGQGGWAMSYAPVGAVDGRLRPASATEIASAAQRMAQVSHVLYTPAHVDLLRGDLVSGAGVTVEVVAVRAPSQAGHHLEVDCLERQKEG